MTPDPNNSEALKPLRVILRQDGSTYAAICEEWRLSGFGESPAEAIDCLVACLRTTLSLVSKRITKDSLQEFAVIEQWSAPAIERDAEVAAMRQIIEELSECLDDQMTHVRWSLTSAQVDEDSEQSLIYCADQRANKAKEAAAKALASTAGTDLLERLAKAVEERDEWKRTVRAIREEPRGGAGMMISDLTEACQDMKRERDAALKELKTLKGQLRCEAPCRHEWYLGQCAHCGIAATKSRL